MNDMYSDSDTEQVPPEGAPQHESKEQDGEGEKTTVIPKEFFGPEPPEVGQTCKIEVTHVGEDSVECRYVESAEKEEGEERRPGPPRPPGGGIPPGGGPPSGGGLYE